MDVKAVAALAAGIAVLGGMACAIAEGLVCSHAIDQIGRNPESYSKIRSTMILGCALCETTGIYALLISILLIFMLGM